MIYKGFKLEQAEYGYWYVFTKNNVFVTYCQGFEKTKEYIDKKLQKEDK